MGAPESRSSVWGFVPFHRAGTQPDGGATEASNGIPERSPPIGPRAASFFNFPPELCRRRRGEGKMGLTRGQWVKFGRLLGLPTTYALRPGEQDGVPCWEICFPPVSLVANKK